MRHSKKKSTDIICDKLSTLSVHPRNQFQRRIVKLTRYQVRKAPAHRDFLTIPEIAERWRIARPTVYNRLRSARVKVLDFASHTGRGRKLVPVGEILKIEAQQFKRL